MKKFLVVLGILAVAAACGGAGTGAGGVESGPPHQVSKPVTGSGQSTGSGGGSTGSGYTSVVPVLQGPPVIRQAQLGIQVGSGTFDSKLSQVRTIVEASGGYIAGTNAQVTTGFNQQDTSIKSGTINFMVPAANFDTTIDQVAKVGNLRSEQITGTDVSAQYVDLNARLANAQAQRDAMLALLKQATNINDIINIQNQIGQITSQIEQLKGQIKYLDDNTAYSSVTVTLTEAPATSASSSDSWGFATALNDAAHNFVATINYFIAGLGAVGPFLVLAGIGLLLWWRRRAPVPRRA